MNDEDPDEELEVGLVVRDESESQKQIRAALFWTGIVVALIAFYVFGFPVLLFGAQSWGWPIDEMDGFPEVFLNLLLAPLEWLYEHSSLYEHWIDWLGESFP